MPHADLVALGIVFFLSRLQWITSQYYLADARGLQAVVFSVEASLLLILMGYGLARMINPRASSWLLRAAVLAMFLYFVEGQLRLQLGPMRGLSLSWQVGFGAAGLAIALVGASRFSSIWPRLRAALLATTIIATLSVFALAAMLAPHIELFADPHPTHRPVLALLLDEFSGRSAQDLVTALTARDLNVETWSVPSIGVNTLDAIPGIFGGHSLLSARPCTRTAVCGHSNVVDFARMKVARSDVDIVGTYHRYCSIEGLRSCQTTLGDDLPPLRAFLCALPSRGLMEPKLGCYRKGYAEFGADVSMVVDQEVMRAPFWQKGGLLYAHLITPHPPSANGETRLRDAYASNLEQTTKLVLEIVDRLERAPFHDDFSLVITSDHHLRTDVWCLMEPYKSHGCDVPESMGGSEVPFIIATHGPSVAHRVPTSNADLIPIIVEVAKPR